MQNPSTAIIMVARLLLIDEGAQTVLYARHILRSLHRRTFLRCTDLRHSLKGDETTRGSACCDCSAAEARQLWHSARSAYQQSSHPQVVQAALRLQGASVAALRLAARGSTVVAPLAAHAVTSNTDGADTAGSSSVNGGKATTGSAIGPQQEEDWDKELLDAVKVQILTSNGCFPPGLVM